MNLECKSKRRTIRQTFVGWHWSNYEISMNDQPSFFLEMPISFLNISYLYCLRWNPNWLRLKKINRRISAPTTDKSVRIRAVWSIVFTWRPVVYRNTSNWLGKFKCSPSAYVRWNIFKRHVPDDPISSAIVVYWSLWMRVVKSDSAVYYFHFSTCVY